jgi:hypothetical protein
MKVLAMSPAIQHALSSVSLNNSGALLSVTKRVSEELTKLLAISVTDVIARGWTTYKGLKEYADELQYPRDEAVTCMLGKHSMDFTDSPTIVIEVLSNPPRKIEVKFDLTLHVDLTGVVLTIKDRRVMEAQVGHCDLSAEVSIGSNQLLHKPLGVYEMAKSFEIPGGMLIMAA